MPLGYNKKSNPNEALGLLIYKTRATNNFLKIKEAWLPKSRLTCLQLPLAWLPMNLVGLVAYNSELMRFGGEIFEWLRR